jgi:hypothetical protein
VTGPELDADYFIHKESMLNASNEQLKLFMAKHNLKYLLIDTSCFGKLGINETNDRVNNLTSTGEFTGVFSAPGIVLLGV